MAGQAHLGAIALTDHDTTEGLVDCAQACRKAGIEFVPGIEISADPDVGPAVWPKADQDSQVKKGTLHMLGLFVRHDDTEIREVSRRMKATREERNPAIIAKLNDLGVSIEYEQVRQLAARQGTGVIGRPHIAQVLLQNGYAKSVQDAFSRYLGQGAAAYVRRDPLPALRAIEAIHHAGGLAFLAHPTQLRLGNDDRLDHMIKRLKDVGLDGIETRHRDHSASEVERFEHLVVRFDLLASGGSDYHGSQGSAELGSQRVPMQVYERLRDAWQAVQSARDARR